MTAASSRAQQRLSAADRRQQLEGAVIAVVAQDGFAAVTAERVVRSAGVSKGLLWHYYANLTELLTSAARRALGVLEAAVAADVDLDAPVDDLLRSAIRRAARLPATHGAELRAVRQIGANLRGDDGALLLREPEYAELYSRQTALLQRGQRQGHIRADLDAALLAVTYQGMVDALLDHLDHHPDVDADAYAQLVADVLLTGITDAPAVSAPAKGRSRRS